MTRDDILLLANKAGWVITHDEANGGGKALLFVRLQAFADLVAAAAPKRDALTTDHKVAMLCTWVAHIQAMELQRDALEAVVGSFPESPLNEAIGALQSGYTRAVAKLVGDAAEWLDWYRFDNQMGAAGQTAGPTSKARPIKTVEDLVWCLETDR